MEDLNDWVPMAASRIFKSLYQVLRENKLRF